MNILLDSDVVLEVLRAKDQAVLVKWSVLTESKDEVFFSPLTAAEVWPRVRPDEHAAIARFFRPLTCAKIDYGVGQLAAELFREYSKSHDVEIADALIAATAIQNQAALWTLNRQHFPMAELTLY
jgi:predicted nucleic acid-binding protein